MLVVCNRVTLQGKLPTCIQCSLLQCPQLSIRVGRKAVDCNHHGHAVRSAVLDVSCQVAAARFEQLHVLGAIRCIEGLPGRHGRPAAVHLQRPHWHGTQSGLHEHVDWSQCCTWR